MAVAKLICGDCSAVISPTDAFCPSCGAKIERSAPPPAVSVCTVCGHKNSSGGPYCESCGARLGGVNGGEGPKPAKREQRREQRPAAKKDRPAKHFEPWQLISGVAVLALVGYLVYSEISRDRPPSFPSGPPASGPPLNVPFLDTAPAGIDLTPLERAVKAAPNDAAALLRLANALHDNKMLPRAIDTYKKYLAVREKDPDARTDLGICYFQMAQIDTVNAFTLLQTAAQEMARAHQDAPTHQPSAFNLGVVYLHMGNLEESNKWFKEAVALNKDSDLGRRAQNILSQHSMSQ